MDWISSDSHWNHTNICKGISSWTSGMCRDFPTLEKMNTAIIKTINDHVMQDDTFYHLGDWSFGGIESIWKFREQLNCKHVILILGNHDTHIENDKVLPNQDCYRNGNWITAKELFKEVYSYYELKVGKQKLILHHHPIDHWRDAEKGSIMLHGHCHGSINNCITNTKFRRMDVGIDWPEFRPYTIDEVITKMNKRPVYERHEGNPIK